MKYVFDLKCIIYSAEGISPLKLSFKHAQSKLYRQARAFLICLLWKLSVAGVGSCQGILTGVVRWSLAVWITSNAHKHIQPFGFCKSVCLFFLYKWNKEGKGEMGGRRSAHPAVECHTCSSWSSLHRPKPEEQTRSISMYLLGAFLYYTYTPRLLKWWQKSVNCVKTGNSQDDNC